jgi:dihydrofolate synthase / folylpolyglutamate synthase
MHCPVLRPSSLAPTMLGRDVDLARLVLGELGERGVRDRAGWPVGGALLDAATIEAARLPGRLERRRHGRVPVVLDGAHVASSVRMVLEELSADPGLPGAPVVVLALGRDKNAREILKVLSAWTDRVLCTTVASGPLSAAETLAAEAKLAGLAAETAADPRAAYARALDIAADARWVLVIGSFHLAGAVRTVIGRESPQPPA